MTLRSIRLAAMAAAVFAHSANGQQPEQQPTSAMPAVPAPTCVAPELPQQFADSRRFERFNREYKAYGGCVNKYIEDTNALATAALAAGKKALDQLNALNAEIKDRQERQPK